MVKTNQALPKDPENKLSDASLDAILRQLFRRAASSIVKEDAAPQIPVEILTRGPK